MTISGWICFILGVIVIAVGMIVACSIFFDMDLKKGLSTTILGTIILSFILFKGFTWYFGNTASGQRALTDEKSELNNGLERVINVYTANGDLIAKYEGVIDIEGNDGGYVVFDFEGKRYTYYNCFIESIAIID